MSLHIQIPESVLRSIRLPEDSMAHDLQVELSLALYARGILSFGKARELAELGKYEFSLLLGDRNIPRHYGAEDLQDDLDYGNG